VSSLSSLLTLYLVRTAHPESPETDENAEDGVRSTE